MAHLETFLFTSEAVNEGHPDKLCDQVEWGGGDWGRVGGPCCRRRAPPRPPPDPPPPQVSDAVLDAILEQDPDAKVRSTRHPPGAAACPPTPLPASVATGPDPVHPRPGAAQPGHARAGTWP